MKSKKTTALKEVDQPFYGYWQALYHSFFNDKLYIDVGKRWRGFGITYLLLLMFIVTIPYSIYTINRFDHFFNQNLLLPFKKLPPLFIQNGQVSLDKPMPYFVKNDDNEIVAIVDTSGTITTMEARFPKLSLLITQNKFFYRTPNLSKFFNTAEENAPINEVTLDKRMTQVFNGEQWIKSSGIGGMRLVFEALVYPSLAAVTFAMYLVFYFAFSFMAQLLAKIVLKHEMSYKQAFRVLVVAGTPQVVVLMLGILFHQLFPGFGLLLISLLAFYFSFGVLSIKRESKKLVLR